MKEILESQLKQKQSKLVEVEGSIGLHETSILKLTEKKKLVEDDIASLEASIGALEGTYEIKNGTFTKKA